LWPNYQFSYIRGELTAVTRKRRIQVLFYSGLSGQKFLYMYMSTARNFY